MGAIKDYKVKKTRLSIISFIVLIVLLFIFPSISKTDYKLISYITTVVVWVGLFVEYRCISMKIEILEELEKNSKNSL